MPTISVISIYQAVGPSHDATEPLNCYSRSNKYMNLSNLCRGDIIPVLLAKTSQFV